MPPVALTISRLLRQQAQSMTTRSLLRQPLLQQQQRTIISQQFSQSSRRLSQSRPSIRTRKPINPSQQPKQKCFSSSTSTNETAHHQSHSQQQQQTKQQAQSFSQRMKTLSREYGWSALGVYLALSALDFPFCFAAVRLFGVERIGYYEHVIVEEAKKLFYSVVPIERATIEGETDAAGGGAEAGEKLTDEGASIWTQLAIAYAVHKSFIFFRVPLTAAVTPKVVKTLRSWGWNIGKKTPKAAK
ncbi:hypothetical protein DPV78_001872 [Talaromyces pinophilus]|nr:hypothetical protein DPV78_001872 [Talaromyces pinophilus]